MEVGSQIDRKTFSYTHSVAPYSFTSLHKIYYQDFSFSTIIRGEVPYRLNVASGNRALSSIAVELCEHLRLVK